LSIPRRLGRLARGFVSGMQRGEDSSPGREAASDARREFEHVKRAFRAAWRGASEEWRERTEAAKARRSTAPKEVRRAYARLGLRVDSRLESVDQARRELVKKYHPDRFSDPEQRRRAEKITAEINAAHDTIERYLMRRGEL
jgi:hypothetical protein